MPSHDLLPSQREEVFHVVKASGLDPREFAWEVQGTYTLDNFHPVLRFRDSSYHFSFENHGMGHQASFSPGLDELLENWPPGRWDERMLPAVASWLGNLQREVSAQDVWGQLEAERELVSATGMTENHPFSADEQEMIAAQFEEVKRYLEKTHSLSSDQFQAIEGRLDYLVEAAGRMGRVDWRNAFVGAMLGLVVEAVVPVEPIRDVLQVLARGLAPLFGLPELPAG